jgi:hypothetical protein
MIGLEDLFENVEPDFEDVFVSLTGDEAGGGTDGEGDPLGGAGGETDTLGGVADE